MEELGGRSRADESNERGDVARPLPHGGREEGSEE